MRNDLEQPETVTETHGETLALMETQASNSSRSLSHASAANASLGCTVHFYKALLAIRCAGSPMWKLATLEVIKASCGVKIIRFTSSEKFRRDSGHDELFASLIVTTHTSLCPSWRTTRICAEGTTVFF